MVCLFHIFFDGIAPNEVALAHEVQAIVGEPCLELALVVDKELIEVDPRDALPLCHALKSGIALNHHMLAVFEVFPQAHIVVKRQHALQVDLGARRAIFDEHHEFFHGSCYAVATHAMRHIVDPTQNKNLARLPLQYGLHALIATLHNVAYNAPIFHMSIVQQLVPLATIGEAVAQHDDVVAPNGEHIKEGGTAAIINVGVGCAVLRPNWPSKQGTHCQ